MSLSAQETTPLPSREGQGVGLTIGADLVSQYIWRGQNLGDFSLQPTLGVGYKGISLSAWGSVGISRLLVLRRRLFPVSCTQDDAHLGRLRRLRFRLPLRYMVHEFCWQRRSER